MTWLTIQAQVDKSKDLFISPLTGILGVTGSFGEIRPDHFHSGIDLRTDNTIGKEVYAVSDGFVSRIYVSPTGFGKAIYIDHPNGVTSVYAHLDRFYRAADKVIKNYQYSNKTFFADIFPKANELPIKKGDIIGYSGNSGGSFGPHLHYELRTTFDQKPINPNPNFIKIIDTIPPIIKSLHIFRLDSNSYANGYNRATEIPITKNHKGYYQTKSIDASGIIGIGIDAYDRLNSYSTQCGFKEISMIVNGQNRYNLILDKFSYSETRYVNSIIDYPTKYIYGKEVVKLFIDPNNYYSGLKGIVEKGRITVKADSSYNIDIIVRDANSNISKLSIQIKGVNPPERTSTNKKNGDNVVFIPCQMDKLIFNDTFTLSFSKNSLYDNLYFNYSYSLNPLVVYSPIIHLHNASIPLHQKATLSIKSNNLPEKYRSKALLITYDNKNKPISAGGEWSKGYVKGLIKTLGDYYIGVDTLAPQINPVNIKQDAKLSRYIQLIIKDDLSGIKNINGYIDNEWILFDYDQKNDMITYLFDNERVKKGNNHTFKISVKDEKGNESTFNCDFFY